MADMIDTFKGTQKLMADLVAGVKKDDLAKATPCHKFDTRALLNHIIGGQHMFAQVASGKPFSPPAGEMPDMVGDDPKSAFDTAAKEAIGAVTAPGALDGTWNFPFGTLPGQIGINVMVLETAVHAWDLAKATGQKSDLDAQLAEALLAGARMMITADTRSGPDAAFGAEVSVPDSASPTDKLMGFLGRKP